MSRSFYFDPTGHDLTVFLGPTEVRLMEICWKHGPITVKKAVFYWNPSPKPAYTTVMTVLGRLAAKGLLRKKKDGKSFLYAAAIDREAFLSERVDTVVTCLRVNFPRSLKP